MYYLRSIAASKWFAATASRRIYLNPDLTLYENRLDNQNVKQIFDLNYSYLANMLPTTAMTNTVYK